MTDVINNTTVLFILIALLSFIIGIVIGKLYAKIRFDKNSIVLKERISHLIKQNTIDRETYFKSLNDYKKQNLQQFDDYKFLVQKEKAYIEDIILELKSSLERIRDEKEHLQIQLSQKSIKLDFTQEKLITHQKELNKLQEKFTTEFEHLANRILEEKSAKFTAQNQANIQQILNPLQEHIKSFEQKIDLSNKEHIARHASLGQYLKSLHEQNIKISTEANNLTKALKGDSKIQGNWGELILERVLEKSGLEKGREYEIEKSFTVNFENKQRLRPDVIIHLPDNKKMIVDSKVSLTAYEQFVNAENETDRSTYLKAHVTSLNRHVYQLSDKKYEELYDIESPNFVLLFVPIEPAFAVAINYDNQLYNKAFEKNIIIVTPSTLLATLRTIDSMWSSNKQQRNAVEIARQAGALYDKFTGLVNDLTKMGQKIDDSKNTYIDAMNKLTHGRGNLINAVEKIKLLGAKAKKSLPKNILKH